MNYEIQTDEAKSFFVDCLAILEKKANDYSDANDVFSNFRKISILCNLPVEKTFLVFMVVKIARIVELLQKPNQNESLSDSLRDIANYACLMELFLKDVENSEKKTV